MPPNWIVDEDIDWSLDPKAIRDTFKESNFEFQFYKKIAKNVIKVLSPQLLAEPHNLNYDEELIYEHLIGPLEKFICGLDDSATRAEVDRTFQYYRSLNQPSKICRRILKTGDVTFSCYDCGLDGTCVVCIDCFHKSAHKDHNYKMSTSDGGGCCDCGDVEAWKQNYACSDHSSSKQNLSISDFEDIELRSKFVQDDKRSTVEKINRLPKDVSSRYHAICQASLYYAHMLLTWDSFDAIPLCLDVKLDEYDAKLEQLLSHEETSKQYFTVLFNDEVHTYDHVINTLVKIIKCTQKTASTIASTVSREGRSLIINDDYKTCKQVRDLIAGVRESGALRVEVIHGSVLAHQAFAIRLIEWIRKMSSLCDAFRIITAYTLLGPDDSIIPEDQRDLPSDGGCEMTLVERIMLSNTIYWKIARVEWNDLFVTTLLTEYSIKSQYGRLITRIYPKIIEYFIQDDHDHSVSILTMTTQIYTVPSLICMLIEEENALSIIAKTLVDTHKRTKRHNLTINFENRHTFDMQGLRRGFYIIADLRHLVNFAPTKWTDQLRKNIIEAVSIFLCLLESMQGMDSVRRQLGQHLEYEPDWESGMTLQSRLVGFITRLVTYCSLDEEVLIATLKEAQSKLLKNGGYKMVTRELFGHVAHCIQYDVSTSPVSVHLPLTRFVAALIVELMSRRPIDRVPYDDSIILLTERENDGKLKHSMIDIMEPSLRTEVMIAQFRSGMWRRNGYSVNNSILYFHEASMRKEMFDRDILVLQECGAVTESNEFIIHLLNKFQLFTWASSDTTREPLVGPKAVSFHNDEDIMTQTMSLAEEFLQLLLTLVNERYRVGVGRIEEDDVIKNEIIQLLCISPSTRSDLSKRLPFTDNELDCIKAVATLKRSTEASTGKYELKDEYYDRFNPFFYHYSRRNQSDALDAQLKRKKNLQEKLICCPPAVPVELTGQFSYLSELLKCDITLMIIGKVLKRTFSHLEKHQVCSTKAPIRFTASDLQLDQCLHLIGLGLYEQERNLLGFNYLQAAHEKDVFFLLKECYEKAKRSKDLVFWLMRKINDVIESITSKHFNEIDDDLKSTLKDIRETFLAILFDCDKAKQENKKRDSELAAQRRERIMAMMKANQDKFLSNSTTKKLVAENLDCDNEASSVDMTFETRLIDKTHLCILCRDEQKVAFDQPTMVLLAYIQRSAVLSKNRAQRRIPHYALTPSNQLKYQQLLTQTGNLSEMYSFTSDNSWSFDATFMPSDLFFGPQISTCGHVMHLDCWQGFFDAILKRETSRPNRNQPHVSFELDKFEILCPLCECISNATIPLLPNYTRFAQERPVIKGSPSNTIFNARPQTIEKSSDNLSSCLHALRGTVDMFKHIRHIKEMSTKIVINHEDKYIRLLQPRAINEVLEELDEGEALGLRDFINSMRTDKFSSSKCTKNLLSSISTLAERIHTVGLDLDKSITNVNHGRIFMLTSWSISYTIQAFERVSRFKGSPLFEDLESSKNLCLTSLLRFSFSSMMIHQSDMMQSLLVRKLRYLLINDEHLSSSPSCLDIDAFEMFVSLFILLQKLYAHIEHDSSQSSSNRSSLSIREELFLSSIGSSGSSKSENSGAHNYAWTTRAFDHEYFRNLLHLMLILNMLQVIISVQNELTESYVDVEVETGHEGEEDGGSRSTVPSETNSTASSSPPKLTQPQQPPNNWQDCLSLHSFYKEVILASGHPNNRMPVVNEGFSIKLKARLLPFLRSCAVLFYHLSQIAPPKTLREKSAFFEGKEFLHPEQKVMKDIADAQQNLPEKDIELEAASEEYDSICQYLDLPTKFCLLLKSKEARHLACVWLRHSRVLILIKSALNEKFAKPSECPQQTATALKRASASSSSLQQQQPQHYLSSGSMLSASTSSVSSLAITQSAAQTDLMPVKFIRQPHLVNRLIELPYDYSELVDKVSDFTCPSIKNEDSRTPTMCLVCGVMLCSHSYCCQRDLNELASNYQLILRQQQQNCRKSGADGDSSGSAGAGRGGSVAGSAARTRALGSVGHYSGGLMTANAVAALSYIGSAAALLGSAAAGANVANLTSGGGAASSGSSSSASSNLTIHQQLVGNCTYHAHECSGGVGLFLRIRNCQILLLSGRSKGCYLPAPYIDDHGETDFGLMRGNPLHLNRQHYEKLQQMWLTHAIPEQISRTLEYSHYASSINWHLH